MTTKVCLTPGVLHFKKVSNMMLGFHAWDLLIVLLIVLLLFGARRLPELGSSLGKSFHLFQKNLHEDQPGIESEKAREQVKVSEVATVKENEHSSY
jgi:sec-independent protein translocase protein TatA